MRLAASPLLARTLRLVLAFSSALSGPLFSVGDAFAQTQAEAAAVAGGAGGMAPMQIQPVGAASPATGEPLQRISPESSLAPTFPLPFQQTARGTAAPGPPTTYSAVVAPLLTNVPGAVWSGARGAAPVPAGAPAAPAEPAAQTPLQDIRLPKAGTRKIRDLLAYYRICLSSLSWNTGPRLIERWDELSGNLARTFGRPRAVKDIRGFFIDHRVLGFTGAYGPMGFRVASNELVAQDAALIYDRYFPRAPAARAAFLRFLRRAERFNPSRRATQFRKVIFHALREGAVLPPEKLADFFDSLIDEGKSESLALYQEQRQPKIVAAFGKAAEESILAVNSGRPPGKRVVGALLMGSFANGAAGPGSDLDVHAITENGSAAYNEEFLKALKSRWKELGIDNPISGFQYALPLSKRLISWVHREPYVIYSPYPQVVSAMRRTAAEEAADAPSRLRTWRGRIFQQAYSIVLRGTLFAYEMWGRLRQGR